MLYRRICYANLLEAKRSQVTAHGSQFSNVSTAPGEWMDKLYDRKSTMIPIMTLFQKYKKNLPWL